MDELRRGPIASWTNCVMDELRHDQLLMDKLLMDELRHDQLLMDESHHPRLSGARKVLKLCSAADHFYSERCFSNVKITPLHSQNVKKTLCA